MPVRPTFSWEYQKKKEKDFRVVALRKQNEPTCMFNQYLACEIRTDQRKCPRLHRPENGIECGR